MLIHVLGPVSLATPDAATAPLPGPRQRTLLAALTAAGGRPVGPERLVDLLWRDTPPANPAAALHSTVFKLRAALDQAAGRDVLVRDALGYRLDLAADDVDAAVFTTLVGEARKRAPQDAVPLLRQALGLWQGEAYTGCEDLEPAAVEAVRLEELRRAAVEQLAQGLLDTGHPTDAVALLQTFVTQHPLREGARDMLMQALRATGRTAEALDVYTDFRQLLADELGLEPSATLQQTHLALLRSDEVARPAARPTAPPTGTRVAPTAAGRRGLPDLRVRYLDLGDGRVIAHGTTGSGPRVVVLLGWVSSLDVVASGRDPRSSLLERLTGRLSLTLYDRHGTGLSPGEVVDYGLEPAVTELAAIVEEIGPPVSLLAMSAAGPVALTLAHRRPEWVDSLVLFGTFANGPRTFADPRMREMVVELVRSHWGIGSKLLADLYRPGISDEAAWHLARVFRDSATPEVAAGYLEHLYDQDVSSLLPQIRVPALVLHYRADRLIWFRGGQEMAAGLPDATIVPLDGRVHLPDVRDLDTIEDAVLTHVLRHASSGATSPVDRGSSGSQPLAAR